MSNEQQRPDSEIKIGVFVWLAVALVGLIAVAMVAMWYLAAGMYESEKAKDPPPPLMLEARLPYDPPAPRLQSDPLAELAALRASEEVRLTTYGWVEGSAEAAHIPIDRAMDLLVENGLPRPAAPRADTEDTSEKN